MRIDILTLFPEMFQTFKTESIIKRAIEKDLVEINIIDFRKYSKDPHQKNHYIETYQYFSLFSLSIFKVHYKMSYC